MYGTFNRDAADSGKMPPSFGCAMLVACFGLMICAVWYKAAHEPPRPQRPDVAILAWHAEDMVKKQLKSPATARFVSAERRSVDRGDGTYLFTGAVDAQNSFGALLRSRWSVILRPVLDDDRGEFRVLYVEIGGQVVLDRRTDQ